MENIGIDLVYWTNILGCGSLVVYAIYVWAQVRGLITPEPFLIYMMRFACMIAFVSPIAARLYLSNQTILFLALALIVSGLLMKMRRMLGF